MIVSVVALVTSYLSQISQIYHVEKFQIPVKNLNNDKYEVSECGFVIVEVMVLSLIVLIVLENVCGGAGGSDDQELR